MTLIFTKPFYSKEALCSRIQKPSFMSRKNVGTSTDSVMYGKSEILLGLHLDRRSSGPPVVYGEIYNTLYYLLLRITVLFYSFQPKVSYMSFHFLYERWLSGGVFPAGSAFTTHRLGRSTLY